MNINKLDRKRQVQVVAALVEGKPRRASRSVEQIPPVARGRARRKPRGEVHTNLSPAFRGGHPPVQQRGRSRDHSRGSVYLVRRIVRRFTGA